MVQGNFVSDAVTKNLYWREGNDGRQYAYFRKMVRGRASVMALGALPAAVVRKKVAELRKKVAVDELDRKLGTGGGGAGAVSKFRDLFAAYREAVRGLDIEGWVAEKNIQKVELIFSVVRGKGFDVEGAEVSEFSVGLLRDYEHEMVVRRRERGREEGWSVEVMEEKLRSVQRTIRSTIHQARSLWAKRVRVSRAYEGINFGEDMQRMLELELGEQTLATYERPSVEVVRGIVDGLEELRVKDPAVWLGAMVEVLTGARRGSVVMARWDWFVDEGLVDEGSGEEVVTFVVRVAKQKVSRVPVVRRDYEALLAARVGDGEWIIPGKTEEEREEVLAKRLVPWLRERGLDRRQPNHELRKLFVDSKDKAHGRDEAKKGAGHTSERMMRTYAEGRALRALTLGDVLAPQRRRVEEKNRQEELAKSVEALRGEVGRLKKKRAGKK